MALSPVGFRPPVRENFPRIGLFYSFRVNGDNDALCPEPFCGLLHKKRTFDRSRIDAHLVRPGIEQVADIIECAYTPAYGNRHEDTCRGAFDHIDDRLPVFV